MSATPAADGRPSVHTLGDSSTGAPRVGPGRSAEACRAALDELSEWRDADFRSPARKARNEQHRRALIAGLYQLGRDRDARRVASCGDGYLVRLVVGADGGHGASLQATTCGHRLCPRCGTRADEPTRRRLAAVLVSRQAAADAAAAARAGRLAAGAPLDEDARRLESGAGHRLAFLTLTVGGWWKADEAADAWAAALELRAAWAAHPVVRALCVGGMARAEMHWSHGPTARRHRGRWHPHLHMAVEMRQWWPAQAGTGARAAVCQPGRRCPACVVAGRSAASLAQHQHPSHAARGRRLLAAADAGCGRDWSIQGVWREVAGAVREARAHPSWRETPSVVDVRPVVIDGDDGGGAQAGRLAREMAKYLTKLTGGPKALHVAHLLAAIEGTHASSWWGAWHALSTDAVTDAEAAREPRRVVLLSGRLLARVAAGGELQPDGWPGWLVEWLRPGRAWGILRRLAWPTGPPDARE